MTPERWQLINTVFHEAFTRPTAEQGAFLDDVCAGDHDLRHEIESLISAHARERDFLEVPALDAAAARMANERDDALVGTLIGAYRIESRLGAGGMGEVYLAEDTKLDRKVAVKFLPKAFEDDELARSRQIREAKAAAALDHPNICSVYEVATLASHSFIVMQYVEGETLSARIRRHALPLGEAVDVSIQIADALSLAHARGIVHRDIKPQNIMITPRGQVKVLDFGLAKRLPLDASAHADLQRGTTTVTTGVVTQPGLVFGTMPYVSPEQARGDAIDGRSDLFSLGALLYECLTGRPAFAGTTPMDICAQVIHIDPPPPSTLNRRVPPALDRVVLKALAKTRDARHQSAEELRMELTAVRASLDLEGAPTGLTIDSPSRRARGIPAVVDIARRPRVWVSAAVVVLMTVGALLWPRAAQYYRPTPEALQWYERGTAALRDGTYYKASKALEQAIAFDDAFALAHARLAEAWSELDYADKASREILRAQSLRDQSPLPPLDAVRLKAITHVALHEFAPAIDAYRRLAEEAPATEKAAAYVDLGRAQEQNDDVPKAEDSYKRASALATQDAAPYLRLGVLYGRQQNLEGASQAFLTAEKLYRAISNIEGEAEVFYQRGFLFKNLNKLREARAQSEATLRLSNDPANPFQQIRALLVLSGVSAAEGNPSEAELQATRAVELARVNGMENQATNGLTWLGNVFLNRGDYSAAEMRYTQALELARRDHGRLNEALALVSLGSLRSQQRRTDEALRYVQQAIPLLQQGGYRKWLAVALTLLGRVHRDRGEYEAALQAFNDQLSRAERVGDTSQVAVAHAEIGSVLERQEHYGAALAQFEESQTISTSLGATLSVGYRLVEGAGVLWRLGRFDEARKALDEATIIAGPATGYKQLLAEVLLTGARLELAAGRFTPAKVKSRQVLDLADGQYSDIVALATLTLGLAEARSGSPRAGVRLGAEAVERATDTGDPRILSDAWLALAEALLDSREPTRALEAAQRAQESFARSGQLDSEWRAWLVASESRRRLGDAAGARESASAAATRLISLEHRFGPEAYRGFLTRPDVQRLLQRLNP